VWLPIGAYGRNLDFLLKKLMNLGFFSKYVDVANLIKFILKLARNSLQIIEFSSFFHFLTEKQKSPSWEICH